MASVVILTVQKGAWAALRQAFLGWPLAGVWERGFQECSCRSQTIKCSWVYLSHLYKQCCCCTTPAFHLTLWNCPRCRQRIPAPAVLSTNLGHRNSAPNPSHVTRRTHPYFLWTLPPCVFLPSDFPLCPLIVIVTVRDVTVHRVLWGPLANRQTWRPA